jgi:hypothetical protein
VTLFAQILVHRMASLKLLNNLAFLVISLTMLGFALSASRSAAGSPRSSKDATRSSSPALPATP